MAFELPIEAEHFKLEKGWKIVPGGYFSGQPNLWSLNLIMADESDSAARATKNIEIPAKGKYNLWVRYESCYGFGSVFSIEVIQNDRIIAKEVFGRKEDKKYFPFNKGYTQQFAWYWHNTDFVYQKMTVDLDAGKAKIVISKEKNQKPAAKRVIDLVYLTDELSIEPGNDWNWRGKIEPPIISRFKTPIYVKVTAIEGSAIVQVQTSLYLIGYYKGPRDIYYALKDKLTEEKPKKGEVLSSGETTGWHKIMVSTVMPPEISFIKKGEGKLIAEIATEKPENVVKKIELAKPEETRSVIVSIGKKRYEEGLLGNNKALTVEEILEKQKKILERYQVSGSPAKKLLLCFALGRQYLKEQFELAIACGANAAAYSSQPEIFGTNPVLSGFDTSVGALSVQNMHMTKECYQGDFTALEARYKKIAQDMEEALGRKIPYRIKLIEESGPPPFETLMTYDGMKKQFEDYLKSEGLTLQDLEKDPDVAFYHQHRFRALVFARLNAKATQLIEKYFPSGTRTNSGSFYPTTGSTPTLARGDDPFLLFKERGVTEFSSEISWGWGGTPDYIGPQVQSYEAALARSLCKYHNCPMGSYLIADGNRGYTGEYVELASYPMYCQDFRWLHYYYFGWIMECTFIGCPDVMKGIKRVSYNLNKVEDEILNSKLAPAKIAIGWSSSTDIWDLSLKSDIPKGPGNCVYPQERLNIYLLLRHLHHPCDILSEEDIAQDYLDNYQAFIWIGDHIKPNAAEKLRKWVENGGTLISVAGGGFFDHYNKPLETLLPVYGIKSSKLEKKVLALRPKLELLHEKPLDQVVFSFEKKKISFDIYGYRQTFQPENGTVIARYQNGEPSCIINKYGKGKAIIMGFLPGPSYFKPAIPLKPYGRGGVDELSQFVPTTFKSEIPDVFTWFLSDIKRSVVCSEPLVEPVVRISKNGFIIFFINFSGKKINVLNVLLDPTEFKGIKNINTIFSKLGKIKRSDDKITIEIKNLDKFGCLKIDMSN
ncbi:MAG: beta-galactosidase trimerization domain-containing protein [Candidatus Omnitrophica bacterium]|nr:beta-galactosidase trimerization domain-containing protein [Candidatus Omnitrophota bacterium]